MATLNNLFSSTDNAALLIILLMATKYIAVLKHGGDKGPAEEVIANGVTTKAVDFVQDLVLTLFPMMLSGPMKADYMKRVFWYFLTLFLCGVVQCIHYYSLKRGPQRFLQKEFNSLRTFILACKLPELYLKNRKNSDCPESPEINKISRSIILTEMTQKQARILQFDFMGCWHKVMIRRKFPVFCYVSIVLLIHL